MSTVTSHAPSITTSSFKRGPIDLEPDKLWKDGLKKRIEEGLQSMVDDAKKARDAELARLPLDHPERNTITQEYDVAMSNIRGLAQEQFVIELERERQERRWQNGQAMLPQWDRALKSEQQEIMDRIKKESSSPVTAAYPDGPLAPEGSSSDREESAAQEETAPIAELATEPPQLEPTKRTPERKSRTEHRAFNGTRSSVEGRSMAEGNAVAEPRLAVDLRPAPVTRPELRSPELRPIDVRPLVFGNPEVMPRDLPAALLEKAEKVLGPDRERERNATPAYITPVRRGSTRGDEHVHAAQLRAAYFQSMPERIEPIQLPFLADESDEEEKIQRPLERRASLRKPSVHERPMDVPMSRSIERQSRPSSERYTARSPPNAIPQIWKPSISPEDEISTSRSHAGLARRGSTASIRSNSSAGVRPSIVEAIPERADSETETPEPGRADTKEIPQVWQPTLSAREKGKQVPPPRTEEDRYSPGSDHSPHYDEPTTYTSPRHSGGHRPDAMSPPPPSGATRPMGRKASLKSLEDRDQPSGYHSSAWLRSKASFTNEDRGYPSTPYRPGSRATHTQDDRDHYYDHPRPYPTPPISAREYLPFSQGYDSRTDSPYQPEQRSATWRAAMMPESPPKRRPSESRPGFFRESSYGKYSYAPPEDEYPTKYDDYQKYAPSSAIPISRPRKPSNNDESDWRSWGPDPPLFRRDSRRESGRGHDYYDYMDRDRDRDREHDYRGRDERDYDHNPRYRTPSYTHDATPSRAYGPRSPPTAYHDLHHRFGGRESRHPPDDDDGDDSEDSERRANRRKRDTDDGWMKPEPRRRDTGDTKTRDHDTRDFDYFASKDDSRRERERRREEESRRERERKREEEDLRRENERKQEEEASRREKERKIQEEESRREKERQREDEELRRERERLRQEDELRRKQEEEDLKRRREEEEVRRERQRKREEEESRREREKLRQEEESRRERERKKEEESRRKREEEAARDLEKKKMEALKLEEEVTRQKEEAEREREAARLLAEQAARKDEEARKREQEVRRKEEEARRQEEEAKEKEEELLRKQEEIQKRSEEVQMKEREAKKKEQEAKKKEQEAKRKEQEAKRKEEEAKKKEEEAKRKEEELKKKEEEARRKEREAKKKEQEVKRKEEEARKKEEVVRRKEEDARKREEEAQQKELEARQKEEAIQQREEELKKREEELKRRETEISDRNEAERLQKKFDEEEREKREQEEQERKEREERERKEMEVQERIEQERRRQVEETQNKEHEQPEPERRRHFTKDPERLEQERLQQEEFRKREEQIRRQKRQESLNAEANWGPPPFPYPSSPPPATPSPAMGRSADANSTKPPSWTTWGSQAKTNPTAPPYTPSQSSPSTPSKPRSGSVNSSSTASFPSGPSFSQSTSPFSGAASSPPTAQEEAEWRRRQEEHFAKQQEQFRREQERLEAVRQQQEGRKAWNKEDYLATIETHNRQWAAVQEKGDLRWRDFPWPMFKVPSNPEEIRIPMIRAYVESDSHPGPDTSKIPRDKEKEVKSRIRDLMKKWHPDRFETFYLKKVIEDERAMVGEGAGSVARALGEILSSVSRSG